MSFIVFKMKQAYQNIIALNLILLIAFSSIGFNIITTFCGGCNGDHVELAFLPSESDKDCTCCAENGYETICCSLPEHQAEQHHHTSSKFAKFDFQSTEAKDGLTKVVQPIVLFPFLLVLLKPVSNSTSPVLFEYFQFVPIIWGKALLFRNCVLRL